MSSSEKTASQTQQTLAADRRDAEETPSSRKSRLHNEANQRRQQRLRQEASLIACDARDDRNILKNGAMLEKQFYNEIRYSCSFFCVSCRLSKFREQVVSFPYRNYNPDAVVAEEEDENGKLIKRNVSWYIDESVSICKDQHDKKLHFICHTCKSALTGSPKPRMPKLSFRNQLNFENTPQELISLNTLEEHLLAQRLIFVKVITLPAGSYPAVIQEGYHCNLIILLL